MKNYPLSRYGAIPKDYHENTCFVTLAERRHRVFLLSFEKEQEPSKISASLDRYAHVCSSI